MHNVLIRRPRLEDCEKLHQFFRTVIADTFAQEDLADLLDDIEQEIAGKIKYLQADLDSNGTDRFFVLAVSNDEIVGTIEYGPSSSLIIECTNGALNKLIEVGSVLVHPDCQKQGIGSLLFNVMILTLSNRGIEEFCLDSGYSRAQRFWIGKFGEPDYWFENFWGENNDHMIWRKKISDIPVVFKL